MSWTPKWVDRMLGRVSNQTLVQSIARKAEPRVWDVIEGRIPMGSPAEVHGYVWAASSLSVQSAAADLAKKASVTDLNEIVSRARTQVADQIVSQLEMFSAPVSRAA